MKKYFLLILLCTLVSSFSSVQAQTQTPPLPKIKNFELGLSIGSPEIIAISGRSVLSTSRTASLSLGTGTLSGQYNFTGDSPLGNYNFLGLSVNPEAVVGSAGLGYRWQYGRVSFNLEAALNLPYFYEKLSGYESFVVVGYLFPISGSVHYEF